MIGATFIILFGSMYAFLGAVIFMVQTRNPGSDDIKTVYAAIDYPDIDRADYL